jgi:hypothetical protein
MALITCGSLVDTREVAKRTKVWLDDRGFETKALESTGSYIVKLVKQVPSAQSWARTEHWKSGFATGMGRLRLKSVKVVGKQTWQGTPFGWLQMVE